MILRKSIEKDVEGIANVLAQSYNIDHIEEGKGIFFNEIKKDHNYIVAEKGGKIIGIVTWIMRGLPKHQLAELDRIAVLPEYRGKGIAKQLFEALIREADEAYRKSDSRLRKLYLLTHADNERAKRFYENLGFKHEATLKQHYYEGKDEHIYSMIFE